MPPIVATTGLRKTYRLGDGAIDAVAGVSLQIEAGEFVAVLGRSGSGKSTLMSLLGLLESADCGTYRFDGRDVGALGEEAKAAVRNRDIGFVFQLPALLPRASALENVGLPLVYAGVRRPERLKRAGALLERVGLESRQEHRPSQLSGGEQQRVVIARALVNDPMLILADEPTGALDVRTGDAILSLLDELHRDGRTIVIVTHAAEVAARAQRRVTLADGSVVADDGTPTAGAAAVSIGGYRRR